jgi:hypothetical protein
VKEGVSSVIDLSILDFLSWEEIELRACGPKDISVDVLKSITEYSNCSADHKTIKLFWKMMESFTEDEKRKYLKFAWGRMKIPSDTSELEYQHKICMYDDRSVEAFPEAHTCFFTIDIPPYTSLEKMTDKFKKAIELCGEIDADYGANNIADEDGNRGGGGYDSY